MEDEPVRDDESYFGDISTDGDSESTDEEWESNDEFIHLLDTQQPAPCQLDDVDFINNLPFECLVHIFRFLSVTDKLVVELINERWKEAVKPTWKDTTEIDFITELQDLRKRDLPYDCDEYVIQVLKRCGRYVTELKIGSPASSRVLRYIRRCSNVKVLVMDFISYKDTPSGILQNMKGLWHLQISGVRPNFRVPALANVSTSNLMFLELSGRIMCDLNDDSYSPEPSDLFKVLFNRMKGLEGLILEDFEIGKSTMVAIGMMQGLKYLALRNCHIDRQFRELKKLKELCYLELHLTYTSAPVFSPRLMMILKIELQKLRHLSFSSQGSLRDMPSIQAFLSFRKLRDLELHYVNLNDPIPRLRFLQRFRCMYSQKVANSTIINLMRKAKTLKYLDLTTTPIESGMFSKIAEEVKRRENEPKKLQLIVSGSDMKLWYFKSKFAPEVEIEAGNIDICLLEFLFIFNWLCYFIPTNFSKWLLMFLLREFGCYPYGGKRPGEFYRELLFQSTWIFLIYGTIKSLWMDEIIVSLDYGINWMLCKYQAQCFVSILTREMRWPLIVLAFHFMYCCFFESTFMMTSYTILMYFWVYRAYYPLNQR